MMFKIIAALSRKKTGPQWKIPMKSFMVAALIFTALILLLGADSWAASAQEADSSEALAAESIADPGFTIAWRDNKGSSNFDLAARGFNVDGSQRFPDFTVNPTTSGDQFWLDIAASASGGFVVVYEDDRDGNDFYNIYMRGFNSDGSQRFSDRRVNPDSSGQQRDPAIAMAPDGSFVVVYEDDRDGNGINDIFMRGFNEDGTERFSERKVNSDSSGRQHSPVVAVDQNGDFVVAWQDDKDGNGFYEILMRGFNSNGSERFSDRVANGVSAGDQRLPAIAMAPNGNFTVAWVWFDEGIYARGFNPDGSERFADVQVYDNPLGPGGLLIMFDVDLAMANDSGFAVAWSTQNYLEVPAGYDSYVGGYNGNGTPRFSSFPVSPNKNGPQIHADVAMNSLGEFVVTWQDDRDENGATQVLATGYAADGTVRIPEFTVNSNAAGSQVIPVVAMGKNHQIFLPYNRGDIPF
jgi:hypothetical protein